MKYFNIYIYNILRMSFCTEIKQEYHVRRIEDWSIRIKDNKICGIFQPFGINIPTYLSGKILAIIDRHVIARVDCRLYAFVLGDVDPCKTQYLHAYNNYLKQKIFHTRIVI